MMDTSVTRADVAHAEVIAALHADCFVEAWDAASITALLETPGAFALIAVDGKGDAAEPAGFILCRSAADECEVLSIGVLPSHRRRGVAKTLLDAAANVACKQGGADFFLEVAEDNSPARAFYGGAGFAEVGRRPGYYVRAPGRRVDALVLRRRLII
ncbi:MAG: GNAT family N-acetyltransferase [Rhodospirillales bacterium]|nr:GNAT family N-acetyltransferase [Rhodospirillales bacterium]MCW8951677.1 GNAT family N-acetyltransferase [Rhodospirillales bacterium]